MSMRKYKRSIIRSRCIKLNGNAEAFHEEWKKFHDAEVEARVEREQNDNKSAVVRNKPVANNCHYDNGKAWLRQMRAIRDHIKNLQRQATKKKAEQPDKVSE